MKIEVLKSAMQYLDNLSERIYQSAMEFHGDLRNDLLREVDTVDKCWQRILRMKERAEQRNANRQMVGT